MSFREKEQGPWRASNPRSSGANTLRPPWERSVCSALPRGQRRPPRARRGPGDRIAPSPTQTPPPLAFCGGRAAELRTKPFACSKGSVSVLLRISVPFSRTKNTEMLEKFPVATGFQVSHNSVV